MTYVIRQKLYCFSKQSKERDMVPATLMEPLFNFDQVYRSLECGVACVKVDGTFYHSKKVLIRMISFSSCTFAEISKRPCWFFGQM